MNGTTLERPDMAAYLAAVRAELADVPGEEREELLADVEASLLDAGEPPRLAPADFAAELREAAGLSPGEAASPPARSLTDSVRAWLASERARALGATARELAPIWWLARAYVAVVVVALLTGWGWPLGSGTRAYGLALESNIFVLAAAAAVSIWLGLRGRRPGAARGRLRLAVNVALALALVPVVAHSFDRLTNRPIAPYTAPPPTPGLAYDGVQIRNLYPYTRDGRQLFDVLLFDENGQPVQIFPDSDDASRRVLVGADGSRLFNSYPIRYFEPGTATVAQPELGPQVTVPEIVTPPLERRPR